MAALPAVPLPTMAAVLSESGQDRQAVASLACTSVSDTIAVSNTIAVSAMPAMATAANPTAVQERSQVRSPYPNSRITVLDDDVNTFQHVVDCLVKILPGMQPDRAWELAHRIDSEGAAVVWTGPQEQAELYHQQLGAQGLTMAPLERA